MFPKRKSTQSRLGIGGTIVSRTETGGSRKDRLGTGISRRGWILCTPL